MALDEGRMPFTSHLTELRKRLVNSVLGVLAATGVAYLVRQWLFALLVRPLVLAWAKHPGQKHQLVFTSPIEAFMVLFKLSLLAGVFLGSPVIFHQIWKFIAPGLYKRERRLAFPFIFVAFALFIGGAAFAYLYVLPAGYEYFLGYTNPAMGLIKDVLGRQVNVHLTPDSFELNPMLAMDEYFSLTSTLLLVFGAVFELPLLLSVLAMLGVVTPGMLWRFNRYAILIAFVAGAVLTPGDLVVGQIAMGGALTVLYNISIIAALIFGRSRRRAAERAAREAAAAAAATGAGDS